MPASTKPPGALPDAPFTPEQKIKVFEVQFREAREKAQLFETVLDVLKKDHGVRIVKKPLGKSAHKSSFRSGVCRGLAGIGMSAASLTTNNCKPTSNAVPSAPARGNPAGVPQDQPPPLLV